ncbi:MAG: hypothetical protein ACRC67_13130, partial [Inquilinus sp.]|uniref:hypothetical protein n=1 Tax=Inquilinus sp. TaxID=1932117 RepID=UPI003F33F6BC
VDRVIDLERQSRPCHRSPLSHTRWVKDNKSRSRPATARRAATVAIYPGIMAASPTWTPSA